MTKKIAYDEVVDAVYIKYSNAAISHTVEVAEDINVDFDDNEEIRGVEVIGVSEFIGEKNMRILTRRREEKISWFLLKKLAEAKCLQST